MENKRKNQRISFREAIQFYHPNDNSYGGCLSRDLSADGMRIRSNEFVSVGTAMDLNFFLTNGEVVETKAKVVWIQRIPHGESYEIGLEFIEADETLFQRRKIHDYISNL